MELKILGKMSVENFENKPRRKSPEYYAPEIKNRMKEMADLVNERYGDILDNEGRVKVKDEDDSRYVRIKEGVWAKERGMSLESYLEKQEKNKSSLAESAVVLSISKVLGDRFLSIRSSSYDDYENGIDNLLMDTETGNLICGFDEVVEGYNQNGQDIKEEKIMKKFKSGGSYAKYGLKLEDNKISISKQKHLPTFYISLNKNELSDLLENIAKPEVTEIEKTVLQDIVYSLEYQLDKVNDENINISSELKNNLENTKSFIETLKEKI